jgi:nitrite reductase (NADH) large subunit
MTNLPVTAWICSVCGYIHYGAEPPEECPVCGASKDQFKPIIDPIIQPEVPLTDKPNFFDSVEHNKIVIVGAGIAGVSAAEAARKTNPTTEILLLSSENHLPYYRLNLTRYLAGELSADQLVIHPEDWYWQNAIQLLLNIRVLSFDLEQGEITLSDNRQMTFDSLLLTVGSTPFVPPFGGSTIKNVFTLRTIEDADGILTACQGGNKCICIGGGLLGLETAGALARRGVNVTVLENQPWLMPRQLNETSAKILLEKIKQVGIEIRTGVKVKGITGDAAVNGVMLEDGTTLPAQVVVISAGIRSNISLAKQAGLSVNQGIIVDAAMHTSAPHVYAAGDAAELNGMLYGTWGPSQGQGTIAGMNAAGKEAEFSSIARSNTLKVLGFDLFSVGKTTPSESTGKVLEYKPGNLYAGFMFEGSVLCGTILLDDISLAATVKKLIDEKKELNDILVKNPTGEEIYQYLMKIKG